MSGDGTGQVGGHARAADEGDEAVVSRAAGHLHDGVGRAVGRQHAFMGLEPELFESRDRRGHLVAVVGRAHEDCDLHVPVLPASAAMSVRWCLPVQRMRSTAA